MRPRPEARPERARGEGDGVLPLVVTLLLDDESQARFDRLRAEHFPPERNHLAAHVTLFHALPREHVDAVLADLRAAAAREPFDVAVTGLRSLGRGVAYVLQSTELTGLRDGLAATWSPWLTPQDRQRHAPHVTVQNKVDPAVARALHDRLLAGFAPWSAHARGLGLWRYEGGPWSPVAEVPFA